MSLDTWIPFATIFTVCLVVLWKKYRQVGKTSPKRETTVVKGDKELSFRHCDHGTFFKREGVLVTSMLALFQMAYWNRSARCYVCSNCGFVHWFLKNKP